MPEDSINRLHARSTCPLCRIIRRQELASVVFEDSLSLAFLDHRPLFPGHCLLVPQAHYETLADLPVPLIGPLFQNAQLLERAIEEGLVPIRITWSVPRGAKNRYQWWRYSADCLTTIAWYQRTGIRGCPLMAKGSASALLLQGVVEPHHLVLQGIDGCLSAVGQVQFRQNVGDMCPDRRFADDQCSGNLLVRAAPRQVGQHLQFSRRYILEGCVLPVTDFLEEAGDQERMRRAFYP